MIYIEAIKREIDAIDQHRKKLEAYKIHEMMPFLSEKRMVNGRLMSLIQLKISAMKSIRWEMNLVLKRGGILPYERH